MKSKTAFLFLLLVIVLAAASCQSNETPSPLSASLSELSGKVDLKQAGEENFAPATSDSRLEVNGQGPNRG
ncbi:MAG: hypothetical protein HND47_15565 [Chloroflexi bacterium]|nr:hypothetical protein [Chloroflexota bacterium]